MSPAETPVARESAVAEFIVDDTAETGGGAFDDLDGGFEVVDELAAPSPPPTWTAPPPVTTLEPSPIKKKKKRKNSLQFLEDIVDSTKLLFLFGSLLAVVLIVFGIMFAPLALGMRFVGGLFTLCGFVYAVRLASEESPVCAIIYFFDCTQIYRLYYTITRWSEMKHAFFAEVFGMLLCIPFGVLIFEEVFDRLPARISVDQFGDEDMEGLPPGWQQFGDPNNPPPSFQQPGNQGVIPEAAPAGQPPVTPNNATPNQGQTPPGNP